MIFGLILAFLQTQHNHFAHGYLPSPLATGKVFREGFLPLQTSRNSFVGRGSGRGRLHKTRKLNLKRHRCASSTAEKQTREGIPSSSSGSMYTLAEPSSERSRAKALEVLEMLDHPALDRRSSLSSLPSSWLRQFVDPDTCLDDAWPLSEDAPSLLEDAGGEIYSSDPNLIKTFNATGLQYEVVRIDSNPDMSFSEREQKLSRRSLLRLSGLRPRDLRRVDPSLSLSTGGPDISVRDNMLLMNIGEVRAIVTNDSALIFKHPSFTCRRFIRLLGNRIKANYKYAISADLEERKLQVPFELVVGEAALISCSSPLEYDLLTSQPLLAKYVKSLRKKLTKDTLENLRQFKQKMTLVESRAQAMCSMLLDLLDDDDDMRRLALSYPRVGGSEEDKEKRAMMVEEWEMLLEYYLLRYETISSEASRLLEEARDLEETVSLTLSSRRLELSRVEIFLSICSLAVGCGAMFAGIFGMNLLSGLEISKGVFWGVTFGILAGASGVGWILLTYVKNQGII
ncbi:hypothetical protein AAMO2058_001379300 [Amorphochlora amoebiformis]